MAPPFSLYQTRVAPSGVEHSLVLSLTPASLHPVPARPSPLGIPIPPGSVVRNLVVANSNRLRIFEIRNEIQLLDQSDTLVQPTDSAEDDGFEMGGVAPHQVDVNPAAPPTSLRLHHVASHNLHGKITGLGAISTLSSLEDGLERLLVTYEEAKMAILEWNDVSQSLQTVSLHTYERTAQVANADLTGFNPLLRTDPDSRCAVLLLPNDHLAVLPVLSSTDALALNLGPANRREIPYAPSYTVALSDVHAKIKHVKDLAFLPGFHSPTVAFLYESKQSWANRPDERDPFTLSVHSIDPTSRSQPTYPLIASISSLPSSCTSLVPCPPSIAGLLVLTPNAIIHVDPSGNAVGVASNLYHAKESSFPAPLSPGVSGLRLEAAKVVFIEGGKRALLLLGDGRMRELGFVKEGRALVRIWIGRTDLAIGPIPSGVLSVALKDGRDMVFVGSLQGDSGLLRVRKVGPEGDDAGEQEAKVEAEEEMEIDDDEDLYGTLSKEPASDEKAASAKVGSSVGGWAVEACDRLKDHGAVVDLTFGMGGPSKEVGNEPQLVAIGGSGHSASFNYFHRDMPALKKRKIANLAGARGLWSLRVPVPEHHHSQHSSSNAGPSSYTRLLDRDSILLVDEDQRKGHTKIFNLPGSKVEPSIVRRIPAKTLAAGEFFQKTCIVQVTSSTVGVVEGDGRERQTIRAPEGIRFVSATVADPYVLVGKSDGSLVLLVGDTIAGSLSETSVDFPSSARCIASCLYSDVSGVFARRAPSKRSETSAEDDDDLDIGLYGRDEDLKKEEQTISVESMMDAGKGSQWLCTLLSDGAFEVRALPDLTVCFASRTLGSLPGSASDEGPVVTDDQDPVMVSGDAEDASKPPPPPTPLVSQMVIAPIGAQSPRPHLFFTTSLGLLVVYEISPTFPSSTASSTTTSSSLPLAIRFSKIISRAVRPPDEEGSTAPDPIPWSLSPFTGLRGLSGVFVTGDFPLWVLKDDASPVTLFTVDERMVWAFTPTSLYGGKGDQYLLSTDEGTILAAFPADVEVHQALPVRRVDMRRSYTHVVFDAPSRYLVGAGLFHVPFEIFDEDDQRVDHQTLDPELLPLSERSSLELISFHTGEVIDGFEFSDNETVLSIKAVTLETKSSPTGRKDYIAVGTGISRGEDLAERGATYIFEVVDVVPHPDRPHFRHGLKRLCKDYSKGAVTALAGMNGYLVSAVAQKLFVRGFDQDERLISVAFKDVGIWTTTISVFKNLLLLGDVVRSTELIAFQEDPFKLVLLGKDHRPQHVSSVNFLVAEGKVGFVMGDRKGYLRMLEYDPSHVDAEAGQKLIHKTEFHSGTEPTSVLAVARRTNDAELVAPQTQLLIGGADGSIATVVAVPEDAFKRLQLLQGQLVRSVQHVSGLNPRAFRTVRNDLVARPLTKGILDGDLLYGTFELLGRERQEEMTKQIGTTLDVVLDDLEGLRGLW